MFKIKNTFILVSLFLSFTNFVQADTNSFVTVQNRFDLSGKWMLTWTDANHGPQNIDLFSIQKPVDRDKYIEIDAPQEIHCALEKAGILEDVNFGMNTLKARWVAEQYWQYYRTFQIKESEVSKNAWLYFSQLDLNATVLINGEVVGTHRNAYIPCRINITGKLKKGENTIAVAIESGLYYVAGKDGLDYGQGMDSILNKRFWQRKPQYQFAWDWNPRLINVGMTGDAFIEFSDRVRLDQVVILTDVAKDYSKADVTVKSFIESVDDSIDCSLTVKIEETGDERTLKIHANKGINPYSTNFTIAKPKLWQPLGHGAQNLYTLNIKLEKDGLILGECTRITGIRKVELDRSPHPVEGEYFTIKVNGHRIFCKGANWVPPDMIYSSIKDNKIEELVDLAVEANFNFIRIWGGGTFAGNKLLELCDIKGILVWHDFLFACAKYPGNDPEFIYEIRKEATWAVREFAYHPSLIAWCGNNENEWISWMSENDIKTKYMPDYGIYHHVLPVIVNTEDPTKIYWPSSPYSPDYKDPNSPIIGDQHPWPFPEGYDTKDFWAFRVFKDRFPNEGGIMGAGVPATLRQFLPENEQFIRSLSWDHHDNLMNLINERTGDSYCMMDFWLGKDYKKMSLDDYSFASGLLQAEGLSEYINNYRMRMFSTSSAIFWMYSDSWPVSNGWTIVDYYLRKKPAYYTVKKVFQPVTVIIAEDGDKIKIFGVNDSPEDWNGQMKCGIFSFSGGISQKTGKRVILPANSSVLINEINKSVWERTGYNVSGVFAALYFNGNVISQQKFLKERFKDCKLVPHPSIEITRERDTVTFVCPVFVWGVCTDINGENDIPDNIFDLIPGIPYTVKWPESSVKPEVLKTGNDLVTR